MIVKQRPARPGGVVAKACRHHARPGQLTNAVLPHPHDQQLLLNFPRHHLAKYLQMKQLDDAPGVRIRQRPEDLDASRRPEDEVDRHELLHPVAQPRRPICLRWSVAFRKPVCDHLLGARVTASAEQIHHL
ncbi:hypothetical protein OG937_10800 [Streptomyces sp. NBC_00510]